ncbi:hypothetical protein OO013_04110 [Mangrovivirga sp. M17]|uniref:DUF5683 domain-containing protein n=1 Tax=Mangrovivirga halotolerans TaxID=2993936 RepID=A0ABT3RNU1_9BACT|nr:hypothetical protein [Mangrovivirga halotolerans]MCX2743034.1 hypothetical protein [Mangrovivirga halotolerans]
MKLIIITTIFVASCCYMKAQYQVQKPTSQFNAYTEINKRHPPEVAGILSAIFPGGGQFYNKQPIKGFVFMALEATSYYFLFKYINKENCSTGQCEVSANDDLSKAIIIFIPVKSISIADAIFSARRINNKLDIYLSGQQNRLSMLHRGEFDMTPVLQIKFNF